MNDFDEWTGWVETPRLSVPDDITDLEYVQVKWNDGIITDLGFQATKNHGWRQNCAANGYIVAYRVRRASAGWDGTGLPPVGVRCEMQKTEGGWVEVEIIAHKEGFGFGWTDDRKVYFSGDWLEFRPIRTEAEKQREADREEIIRILNGSKPVANAILDAGFTRGGEK